MRNKNHRIGGGRNRPGAVLALVIGGALISVEGVAIETKANGWITFPECGHAGINILEQSVTQPFSPPMCLEKRCTGSQRQDEGN
jgi:hypothetical protein